MYLDNNLSSAIDSRIAELKAQIAALKSAKREAKILIKDRDAVESGKRSSISDREFADRHSVLMATCRQNGVH